MSKERFYDELQQVLKKKDTYLLNQFLKKELEHSREKTEKRILEFLITTKNVKKKIFLLRNYLDANRYISLEDFTVIIKNTDVKASIYLRNYIIKRIACRNNVNPTNNKHITSKDVQPLCSLMKEIYNRKYLKDLAPRLITHISYKANTVFIHELFLHNVNDNEITSNMLTTNYFIKKQNLYITFSIDSLKTDKWIIIAALKNPRISKRVIYSINKYIMLYIENGDAKQVYEELKTIIDFVGVENIKPVLMYADCIFPEELVKKLHQQCSARVIMAWYKDPNLSKFIVKNFYEQIIPIKFFDKAVKKLTSNPAFSLEDITRIKNIKRV